ncbi:MAG: cytochrome c-type biogenesis protein [Thermoanaerobaculia bacterium]|nr:cytochrome c-type biogenesis protein [Thermoanaerobaculia bacterium]
MRRLGAGLVAALLLAGGAAALQESAVDVRAAVGAPAGRPLTGDELEARAQALGSTMRCPVCQGLSIADSPSSSASAMLDQVRELLAEGYSEEQVLAYFERSYGEFVLLQPKAEGFNLVVWLAPLIAVAIGLALVLRRMGRKREPAPAAAGEELDDYLARVRSEAGR